MKFNNFYTFVLGFELSITITSGAGSPLKKKRMRINKKTAIAPYRHFLLF